MGNKLSLSDKYTLDTNALITPYRSYYSFERAPRFWSELMSAMERGDILLIDRVYQELVRTDDALSNWIKQSEELTVIGTKAQDILEKYSEVLNYVQTNNCYNDKALREWSDAGVADPWLVAVASVQGLVVVSFETPNAGLNPTNPSSSPKIPDACRYFSVDTVDLFTMMDDLGIKP